MAEEFIALSEHTNLSLLNTDIKNIVGCANCVLMKRQMEDSILQLNSLIELLRQDDEELKNSRGEGIRVTKWVDIVFSSGYMLNIAKEREESPENKYRDCVRLKLGMNYATSELESKQTKNKQTPWPLVRERTIPTERPPLVDEI
jgi:hypothetical protein